MFLSVGCKISYGIIRRAILLTQSFCLSHSQGCSQIIHFIHNLLSWISKITTTATALLKYFSSSKALWGSWGQERSLYKYKSFCFFVWATLSANTQWAVGGVTVVWVTWMAFLLVGDYLDSHWMCSAGTDDPSSHLCSTQALSTLHYPSPQHRLLFRHPGNLWGFLSIAFCAYGA